MSDVAKSLENILPKEDAFHAVAAEIPLMKRMIGDGRIGNKGTAGGFYRRKDATTRETLDFDSYEYRGSDNDRPAIAAEAEARGDFTLLLDDDSQYGQYAWRILSDTLCYAALLVPDVNESLVAVDDAMKLGYNWIQGPFEMLDEIGVDRFIGRLEQENRDVPAFVRTATGQSFYRVQDGELQYLLADGSYAALRRPDGVSRFSELRRTIKPILENEVASYFPLDNDLGLVEFHSKANTLDGESMKLIEEAVAHATANCRALLIHNDAQHFSCGVNLQGVLDHIVADDFAGIDQFLDHFQQTCLSLRNAPIPVIAAASGLSLGGGFEVVLHTDRAIFHANSVTGLVETLVGVVPGGGGVKEMVYRWTDQLGDASKGAWQAFINVGYGKTARSPLEAREMCLFRDGVDDYLMNRDRLLDAAISAANTMVPGYSSVARDPLTAAGRDACAEMTEWLGKAKAKGHLTPHDVTTGSMVAMIVTGGDVDAGAEVSEQDLLDLERQAFVTLCQTQETRARIEHMLQYGSPLRN